MEARGRNRDLDGHERATCRQELKREGKERSPSRSESRWGGVEAGKGRPGIQDHTHPATGRQWKRPSHRPGRRR